MVKYIDESDHVPPSAQEAKSAGYGEAMLLRDPVTGELTTIERTDERTADEIARIAPGQHDLNLPLAPSTDGGNIVKQLEASAALQPAKRKPNQSDTERDWIERMVQKHGDGTEDRSSLMRMQRDSKMNVWQYSQGQILQRLKRWKEWKAQHDG